MLGHFVKNRRKILRLFFSFFMSIPSMVKRSEKTFILFRFGAKQSEKTFSNRKQIEAKRTNFGRET